MFLGCQDEQHREMAFEYHLLLHLIAIEENLRKIMASLDDLLADAQAESTADDSIIALLQSVQQQLNAITAGSLTPEQQAKVDQVFSILEANKAKVTAAVQPAPPAGGTPTPTPTT